jgi:hypothetical protein
MPTFLIASPFAAMGKKEIYFLKLFLLFISVS